MTAEEWRPIAGFPRYQVSDQGRVASLWRGRRLLRTADPEKRYQRASLRRDGQTYVTNVHVLVCEAFHGPRPEGMVVRHLDGDRDNNAASNLRWGTSSENALDRVRHGNDAQARKTHCPKHHPLDAANTYVSPDGSRSCKTCRRAAQRDYVIRRAFRAAGISTAA